MAYQKVNYQPGDVLTAEQVNLLQDAVMKTEGTLEQHLGDHDVTLEELGAKDYVVEYKTGALSYIKWNSGIVELWGEVALSEHGDDRHIYENLNLPFAVYNPVLTMTLKEAEIVPAVQAPSVLTYRQLDGSNSVIRCSMIRTSGDLSNVDWVLVSVSIRGIWKV